MRRNLPVRPLVLALLGGAFACATISAPVYAQTSQAATQALLEKAHTLEVRGRMDMAAQTWQQVLLSDPNNAEALGGLARSAKLSGNMALSNTYTERLRTVNPKDPGLARIDGINAQQNQTAALQQAGKYAEAGQYAQSMAIYRKVFGNAPPAGDWALAYYETESATEDGRAHAIAGLRGLTEKFPTDSRYQIALGRILTYNPKTRSEGRRYLERHPADPEAVKALRQSLVWDAQNPASAADLRAYLAKHNDPQLAEALHNQPKPAPAQVRTSTSGAPGPAQDSPEVIADRARGAEMEEAYKSLNAKHIEEAEARFKAILANDPQSARALAGLGYIRMQQSNFGAAISFLEQAKQNGAKDTGLDTALESARFYSTMSEGAVALNENDLTTAEQQYQAALALRPNSSEALEGLGGTLLKAQQPQAAIQVYERYVKIKPTAPSAWRGLFMAHYGAGNAPQALNTERRIPASVRSQLMQDPDFLRTLASAYSSVGRDADAQRVLRSALDLPFPADAGGLKVETQLQYAGLLQQANHLDQAAGLFRQVLAVDPNNAAAWQGMVRIEHALKQDPQALQALTSMPPSIYETSMRDLGFQQTVASVYQGANRLDAAQQILEHAISQETAANQKPSAALELQLAGIYLSRNNTRQAYPIYRQVLSESPDRPDAWKGLLTVLHGANRDGEALAQAQHIPDQVRVQLESDPEYLQTMGAVYNALGQPSQAMVFISRVQQHYAAQHAAAPADVDIQDAWLLFNGANDAGLYRQLMLLGGRQDLNDEQRRTVQTIWTNWAVRRANQAAAAGNEKRSLAILNAAAKAFPENPGVLRALASGYARAGIPKQAVIIFKAQDMTAATASDYKAAVGAALITGDTKDAETWLRYGLDAYPRDAQMLTLGARFEQARGNSGRAADYFRASLAALPPGDPGAELATELSQPMPATRLPSATRSQDLASLLSGNAADDGLGAGQTTEAPRPYLPSYGNTSGEAPVQLPGSATYTGSSAVVPSYMANPSYRSNQTRPGTRSTLKDYVPQASAAQQSLGDLGPPSMQSSSLPPSAPTMPPAINPGASSYVEPPPQQAAVSPRDPFGPYVPYVPPSAGAGFTPTPVPVQLGDNSAQVGPAQREVTDVLPTARYMPNAQGGGNSGRTNGLGRPDDYSSPPTQNMQFTPQPRQSGDSSGQQYPQPDIPASSAPHNTRRRASYGSPAPAPSSPLPSSAAPLNYPSVTPPLSSQPYPVIGPPAPVGTPPSDAELAAKNVPPLRGSYDPAGTVPTGNLSQREQTETDLASLEASYSAWIGGTGSARYRSGTPGFDRLVDIESPVEASAVLGKSLRVSVVPRPVFLNSGVIDNASLQNATGTVPVLGTFPGNALTTPAQQFSSGIGGEFQLTSNHVNLALGYTPYNFLVSNITGRAQFHLGSHFTIFGDRDPVKDTQLSYAGMRDPGSITNIYSGNIWGGVISTTAGARIDVGGEKSGLYLSADGGTLTGYHVLDNKKYEGLIGAYFRVARWPGYGTLNVGGSLFAEHYENNQRGMTYGLGGYFSPNVYFLASIPVTYAGHYKSDFHYTINAAAGVQTFQEDSAVYFPLDRALQTGFSNSTYALNSNTGLNYALDSEGSYRIADHWYVGGFLSANNSNNYNTASGGFFIRYLFKQQQPTEDYPSGLFPVVGFRPLRVP